MTFPDGELERAAELGAIDDRSVRVWVRWPGAVRLKATLEVEGREPVMATAEFSADRDWTGAIVVSLPEPAPGAPFSLSLGDRRLTGHLAPTPGAAAGLTFGFGSCNQPFASDDGRIVVRDDAAIYPVMTDDLRGAGAQRLLLLGDQIYADDLDEISVRDDPSLRSGQALSDDPDHPPPFETVLSAYRRIYRGFFNQPGFRGLRESFPTLCIWDDHDIFDNWGSEGGETALDQRLFQAAARTYCEYQHQRNPGGSIEPPPYGYWFSHGDIGFVVLDVRGRRDYESGRILGAEQWEWLQALMRSDAIQQMHTLFVATSVPVAHVSRWFTRIFETRAAPHSGSMRDRWNSTAFVESRDALLDLLFDWQLAAPRRQVYFLSGDVHAASGFSIRRRRGPGVIRQITSSAMTTPLVLTQIVFNRVVVHAPNLFEPRFRFQRHFLSITHNFGLAHVEPLAGGGHRVDVSIRSWDAEQCRLRTAGRLITVPEG